MTARGAKPGAKPGLRQRCGGLFTADPDVPPDQNGRQACRCGLLGKAGDAHHALPEAPADDVQRWAAGERSER